MSEATTWDETSDFAEMDLNTWDWLSDLLPSEDLTAWAAQTKAESEGPDPVARTAKLTTGIVESETPCSESILHSVAKALHRREFAHVLITGRKGVGKTSVVRDLAQRMASSDYPALSGKRLLWLDVSNVGVEDSRACLESIGEVAASNADVILCLDGLDAILKRPNGGTNKPLLRAIASRPGVQIIGILDRWAFNDLIAGDARMLELFTRIDVEEPNEEFARDVLQRKASEFQHDYCLQIDDEVIDRIIALASNYVLNECHPAKAIKILRQACDNVDFDANRISPDSENETRPRTVTIDDVTHVVSETTGIPVSTLSGQSDAGNIERILAEAVLGQDRAVQAAATELRLIKSGLSEPSKPAGVLLFAGMTGVGKTELAKRIAELYSTSKRLQTYSMGNFTEPHSVSGIIGVPPGYVGHEEGGRLINELNADPYSVFLLDEAEKCHPNVWKPFLNLFDEGWIVDQRGVKAYADRAIFILTTNAGDKTIAQMSRQNKPEEEIVNRVKSTLSRVRQERSSQPVFTPQFLSRLKRIVVFGPLDEAAMVGITRKIIGQVAGLWRQKREKELVVPDEVIERIGHRAHELNEKSNGEEGGRIVRKLISDLIEHNVQLEATERRNEYQQCHRICVGLNDEDHDQSMSVSVSFE